MSFISKYTGSEIENILDKITESGGITIVNSTGQLDPDAGLGSLACVVEPSSISETLISELPQPDSSIINMDTGFVDATSCPQVSGLSIIVPEGPIPVSMELTENEMLYFCSESLDLMNMTTGIALVIFPQIVNNEIIALVGMYMNVITMEQKEWLLFQIQDGVVTADQTAIDECNTYIKDLYYIGAMNYVMQGLSLTTEQLIIYDNVIKVVAGVPSKAHVYLKKDNWEELHTELNKIIDSLRKDINKNSENISEGLENVENLIPKSIDELSGSEEYLKQKQVFIIQQTEPLIIESNTDYYIVQQFNGQITLADDFTGKATVNLCTINEPSVSNAKKVKSDTFDYGRQLITVYKLDSFAEYYITQLKSTQIDYTLDIPEGTTLTIPGTCYCNGIKLNKGDTISAGVHQLTSFGLLSVRTGSGSYTQTHIFGEDYLTTLSISHGIDSITIDIWADNLTQIFIPQTIRKVSSKVLDYTPNLKAINVISTDVFFKINYYWSGTNDKRNMMGLLYNKGIINPTESEIIVVPEDIEYIEHSAWTNWLGFYNSYSDTYSRGVMCFKRGRYTLCGGCLDGNVDLAFYNLKDINDFEHYTYWLSSNPLYKKYLLKYSPYLNSTSTPSLNLDGSYNNIFKGVCANQITLSYDYDLSESTINKLIISNTCPKIDSSHLTSANVTNILVQEGNAVYDSRNNCNALIETNSNALIKGSNNTIIPNDITAIRTEAFENCTLLTNITIPDSVTSIGTYAFSNCSSLTNVTIGNSVTSISSFVFDDCGSLTNVYCKATTPPALGNNTVFDSVSSDCKIYVPTESVEAYKSATYWSEYASSIVGYDFE